jgi:hypothetical protein
MKREMLLSKAEWVLTNATSQDFMLNALKPGGLVCYDRIAGGSLSKAVPCLTIGFKASGAEFLLESFVTTVAAQIKAVVGPIYVPSDYVPFIRVTTGTAGDKVTLLAVGYQTDRVE